MPLHSLSMTSPLVALGTKFLPDLKCQHYCPDNFHSITLHVLRCRALIGAREGEALSITLLLGK